MTTPLDVTAQSVAGVDAHDGRGHRLPWPGTPPLTTSGWPRTPCSVTVQPSGRRRPRASSTSRHNRPPPTPLGGANGRLGRTWLPPRRWRSRRRRCPRQSLSHRPMTPTSTPTPPRPTTAPRPQSRSTSHPTSARTCGSGGCSTVARCCPHSSCSTPWTGAAAVSSTSWRRTGLEPRGHHLEQQAGVRDWGGSIAGYGDDRPAGDGRPDIDGDRRRNLLVRGSSAPPRRAATVKGGQVARPGLHPHGRWGLTRGPTSRACSTGIGEPAQEPQAEHLAGTANLPGDAQVVLGSLQVTVRVLTWNGHGDAGAEGDAHPLASTAMGSSCASLIRSDAPPAPLGPATLPRTITKVSPRSGDQVPRA